MGPPRHWQLKPFQLTHTSSYERLSGLQIDRASIVVYNSRGFWLLGRLFQCLHNSTKINQKWICLGMHRLLRRNN